MPYSFSNFARIPYQIAAEMTPAIRPSATAARTRFAAEPAPCDATTASRQRGHTTFPFASKYTSLIGSPHAAHTVTPGGDAAGATDVAGTGSPTPAGAAGS